MAMARSIKANNEAYKLLELTDHSDSDLDLPELISSPRRKVQRRKLKRFRKLSTGPSQHLDKVCVCNVRVFTVWLAAILLTIWIITLTWLVIVLHNQIERLDSAVRQGTIFSYHYHFNNNSSNNNMGACAFI